MSIMLPSDFESLAESAKALGLRDAVESIGVFVRAHPKWAQIDTRDLRTLKLDPYTLTRAVLYLVDAGVFEQRYAVTTPSGSLADDVFADPATIPESLPDRFNQYYATADQDVVPVLVAGPRR